MSNNSCYLVHGSDPILAPSNEFQVRSGAIRLFGANLGINYNVQVYVGATDEGIWVNAWFQNRQLILSDINNVIVLMVAGQYRIVTYDDSAPLAGAIVYFEESIATDHDDKVIYTYPTATSGGGGGQGPPGPPGPSGATGATGAAGPTGGIGPIGATGAAGATGPTGDAGPQGPPGVAGNLSIVSVPGNIPGNIQIPSVGPVIGTCILVNIEGDRQFILPPAVDNLCMFHFSALGTTGNDTVGPNAGDTINGSPDAIVIPNDTYLSLMNDQIGDGWIVCGKGLTL